LIIVLQAMEVLLSFRCVALPIAIGINFGSLFEILKYFFFYWSGTKHPFRGWGRL